METNPYDEVAYPGSINTDTHPDRLAVMAVLHGLTPAPVNRCRVLELGCSEGANLIPMAYAIPTSEFVGLDLAGLPIARGQKRIQDLGLSNINLLQGDLANLQQDLGQFDYIIAHGVYAWVPEPIRDALLALCKRSLKPQGIAFISYNALPGGYLRNLMRDILLQAGPGSGKASDIVDRGLHLVNFVAALRPEGDPMRALLEKNAWQMSSRFPEVVYHDELATAQRPVLFSEFVAHAAKHGLQYLSESTIPAANDPSYKADAVAGGVQLCGKDPIAREQIFDFARMRAYRETLLCHSEKDVSFSLLTENLRQLRLACQANQAPGETAQAQVFTLPGGIRLETEHAGTIGMMQALVAAWPRSVSCTQAMEILKANQATEAEALGLVLRLVIARMISLHTWEAPVAGSIAECPVASAYSRYKIVETPEVTTLLHTSLHLTDPLLRTFVPLLDGTRNHVDLASALQREYPEMSVEAITAGMEPSLKLLHRSGMLLAEDFVHASQTY